MAHTTPITLPHTPLTHQITISLFSPISNATTIRVQLLASNPDYDYAFIDAASVLSTTHVLAAVERAIRDWSAGRGKSRNVHSEVVFALGGSNNVSFDVLVLVVGR
jgi:EKC/KEOPS complex subunit CGI121/TPRKB